MKPKRSKGSLVSDLKVRVFALLSAPDVIKPESNTGYPAESLSLKGKFFIA